MAASPLPDEMIQTILSRLPTKSILRFRCVSKHWLALIDDPDFTKFHLHPSIIVVDRLLTSRIILPRTSIYLLDQDVQLQSPPFNLFHYKDVAGSCNGVVCLIKCNDDDVLLVNPITREYKIFNFDNKLKRQPTRYGFCHSANTKGRYVYGLGCDSDGYKLVQFISYRSSFWYGRYYNDDGDEIEQNSEINVYSLADSSCLTISDIPYCFANIEEWGIYLNGAIHWVGKRISSRHEKLIVCFDVKEKAIRELALPDVDEKTCVTLGVLGGQICIFLNMYCEIWVMKNYGSSSSWDKLASIDTNVFRLKCEYEYFMHSWLSATRVLCFDKSGGILLRCCKKFLLHNPEQNTSRFIDIVGMDEGHRAHSVITSVASYVPLNSGSYLSVDTRRKRKP